MARGYRDWVHIDFNAVTTRKSWDSKWMKCRLKMRPKASGPCSRYMVLSTNSGEGFYIENMKEYLREILLQPALYVNYPVVAFERLVDAERFITNVEML